MNKKKCLIQITGLDVVDKTVVKAIKKATKGANGLQFKINPYYVKDGDNNVTVKTKKDGSLKSVSVVISGKPYKLKKNEWSYDPDTKRITFQGNNLSGSWTVN